MTYRLPASGISEEHDAAWASSSTFRGRCAAASDKIPNAVCSQNVTSMLMYAQDFLVMAPTYFVPRRQIVFWRARAGALWGVGEVERLDRSPGAESFRFVELPALHYSLKTFPSPKAHDASASGELGQRGRSLNRLRSHFDMPKSPGPLLFSDDFCKTTYRVPASPVHSRVNEEEGPGENLRALVRKDNDLPIMQDPSLSARQCMSTLGLQHTCIHASSLPPATQAQDRWCAR
ncbi:uncharacterized protein ARMOST_10301 [Armillaria ostoyae]|uniref:Uncharacterized protein n=1 Tax=Armillaria ostoyae TaxID=47428 RepID=A0A284RDW7_ARMOS|nr:uncharacterized protein ARMOST_10301 [Armillaria ostoyae]